MQQYIINAAHCSVFGMDVHARSISVSGFDRSTGELVRKRFTDCPNTMEVTTWMKARVAGPWYAAYESGCTGFHLLRQMREQGIDCDVIAVSSIARSTDDKQRKTDKKDAKRLLAELLSPAPEYSVVWAPDEECEAARDLARCRSDTVDAKKRAEQQLSALLLRHGLVWNEKTESGRIKKRWGKEHWAWVEKADLGEETATVVLQCYIRTVKECAGRVAELSALVEAKAGAPRWKPYVDALRLLAGIDTQTAFLTAASFGDFSRFKNGRAVSRWLGTVPKENSSGEHTAHGHITKAGDAHLRCALVEGAMSMSRFGGGSKRPKKGCDVSPAVSALCTKANRRLKVRHTHLIADTKLHANKARIAIVSELARWAWAVGCEVQRSLEAAT